MRNSSSVTESLGFFHPRKARSRGSFLAALALLSVTLYIFISTRNPMSLSPSLRSFASSDGNTQQIPPLDVPTKFDSPSSHSGQLKGSARKHSKGRLGKVQAPLRPQVHLDQAQELAAVSFFLTSLPQNVIPHFVDPAVEIDPELILDFDTRNEKAVEELNALVKETWIANPVILYSKHYSPASRELKSILSGMKLRPAPMVFDVDLRDDAEVLEPILTRLTSSTELPVLLVGGKSVGSVEQIKALHASGQLSKLINAAGAVEEKGKRRKGKK